MNMGARHLLWAAATVLVGCIGAAVLSPYVLVGVMVGVAMSELKNIDCERK